MTIEEKKVDVNNKFNEIISNAKQKLRKEIVDNPKFETAFLEELNYLYRKTMSLDFNVDIGLDNNYILLTTNSPINDTIVDDYKDKIKTYIQTRIFLNNTDLCVEYNQGVLIDRNDLEKQGFKILLKYESKLETYYSVSYYNKDGVKISFSSYEDSFPLEEKIEDISLKEKILSSFYKPVFHKDTLATMPIHVSKANAKNVYKKEGQYSIIHFNTAIATKDGYIDIKSNLFTVHSEFPDLLRGDKIIAKSEIQNGKVVLYPEKSYAETLDDAYKKASMELKEKLKDANINKNTLDCIMNNI